MGFGVGGGVAGGGVPPGGGVGPGLSLPGGGDSNGLPDGELLGLGPIGNGRHGEPSGPMTGAGVAPNAGEGGKTTSLGHGARVGDGEGDAWLAQPIPDSGPHDAPYG